MIAHYLDPSAWVKRYFEGPRSSTVAWIFDAAALRQTSAAARDGRPIPDTAAQPSPRNRSAVGRAVFSGGNSP